MTNHLRLNSLKTAIFILIMNLQFEQSMAPCSVLWCSLKLELNHMKTSFLTLVWRVTWPMAPTWNTYMWSLHVFSALPHGMVIRFRKSPSQEKLADAACPFLIKPLKSHSITFAAL